MGIAALALKVGDIFVHGALCHLPVLEVVAGGAVMPEAARLDGYRQVQVQGWPNAGLIAAEGKAVAGWLLRDVTDMVQARIVHWSCDAREWAEVRVLVSAVQAGARAAGAVAEAGQADWDQVAWLRDHAEIAVGVAREVMTAFGTERAGQVAGRFPMLAVREASRLRAGREVRRAEVRRDPGAGDVAVEALRQPYQNYFAVEEYDLRFRRFDGRMTGVVNRATLVSGDAAVVLPYDPVRDRVLVVEQFRPAPFARGDAMAWQLEPVAGRIDAGETPEQAARREAVEEAGLVLQALIPIANYYPSPGAKTEYLFTFLGIADLPDVAAGLGGLAEEGEDIRGHVLEFPRLMHLIETGEVATGPLILSALWLAARREALRRDFGSA